MKAITIRDIDPEVAKKLKATASEQNKSMNQLVLEFIKKIWVLKKKKYMTVNTMTLILCLEAGATTNLIASRIK